MNMCTSNQGISRIKFGKFILFVSNWVLPDKEIKPSHQGTWHVHMKLGTSNREIHMKSGTSKQGISCEIWKFERTLGSPIKEIHLKFGTSKHGNSYEIWGFQSGKFKCWYEIIGASRQGNSYENVHFQSGKPLTGEFICSFEVGYFQTGIMKLGAFKEGIFIWNWVLSNREVPMFICYRALPSRYFIWNCSCPIREIHMKLGISKTRISYEIWHLQAVTVSYVHLKFNMLKTQMWKVNNSKGRLSPVKMFPIFLRNRSTKLEALS